MISRLSTAANTGRLMQKSEIIRSGPPGSACTVDSFSTCTTAPSRRRCRPVAHHQLVGSEAVQHLDRARLALAEPYLAALGAAVGDDEHVGAAAFGEHRLLGDQHRRPLLQHDADVHEHAGRQLQLGIGQHGAHPEGARHLADAAVDGRDLAGEGLARKGGAGGLDELVLPHPAEEDLRHAELDLDLGEVVERGQHGLVVDPCADVDAADADDAGERRPHGAIGELL